MTFLVVVDLRGGSREQPESRKRVHHNQDMLVAAFRFLQRAKVVDANDLERRGSVRHHLHLAFARVRGCICYDAYDTVVNVIYDSFAHRREPVGGINILEGLFDPAMRHFVMINSRLIMFSIMASGTTNLGRSGPLR